VIIEEQVEHRGHDVQHRHAVLGDGGLSRAAQHQADTASNRLFPLPRAPSMSTTAPCPLARATVSNEQAMCPSSASLPRIGESDTRKTILLFRVC
jgi:hypothetical protein